MNRPTCSIIGAPQFSRQEIIGKAEGLSERFLRQFWTGEVSPNLVGINFDVVYEHLIYPEYQIALIEDEDLGVDDDGEKILGKFVPETNTAFIDCSLRQDPRRVFTCWHEVGGHGVLQGDWLRHRMRQMQARAIVTTEAMLSQETILELECQANLFGAHAGVPSKLLDHVVFNVFDRIQPFEYRGPGRYTFDVYRQTTWRDVDDFMQFVWMLAKFLQPRFGWISAEAIGYRLLDMKLVRNLSPTRWGLHRVARKPSGKSPFGEGRVKGYAPPSQQFADTLSR